MPPSGPARAGSSSPRARCFARQRCAALVSRPQRQLDAPNLTPASKQYYVETAVQIIETIRGLNELYGKLYF